MYLVVEVLYTKVPNLGKFVLVSPLMSKHFLYIRKRIIIIVIDAIVKSCTHHIHDWKNVFCLFPCCNIGKKPPDHVLMCKDRGCFDSFDYCEEFH